MKYTKKVTLAFERTIRAYDRLIADPEREQEKWKRYGNLDACRMCVAVRRETLQDPCDRCPLSRGVCGGCAVPSLESLSFALWDGERVADTATARRQWLLDTANACEGFEHGYDPDWMKRC